MKKLLLFLLCFVAAGSLVANVLLYNRYSAKRPLIRVGPEAITRKDYQDAVDYKYAYGKEAMTKLVFAKMIMQAAAKAGVTPTESDINKRFAELKQAYPRPVQQAEADSTRLAELRRDIAADLAFENLRTRDVKVSDTEAQNFYDANKAALTTPAQTSGLVVLAKNEVDAGTAAEMMRRRMSADVIAQQPRLGVVGLHGFNPDLSELPVETTKRIQNAVFSTKPGGVITVPFPFQGKSLFLIYRADKKTAPSVPTLPQVKAKIVRLLKLQKAVPQNVVLAKIYKDANVSFETDTYKPFFDELEMAQEQQTTK